MLIGLIILLLTRVQLFLTLANPNDTTLDVYAFAAFAVFVGFGVVVYNHGHVLLWHALTHLHVVNGDNTQLSVSALVPRVGLQLLLTSFTGVCCILQ